MNKNLYSKSRLRHWFSLDIIEKYLLSFICIDFTRVFMLPNMRTFLFVARNSFDFHQKAPLGVAHSGLSKSLTMTMMLFLQGQILGGIQIFSKKCIQFKYLLRKYTSTGKLWMQSRGMTWQHLGKSCERLSSSKS